MKLKTLSLSLGVAVLLCMSAAFAQTYTFQTVNYPGDTFTQLLGINNSDEIAGYHGAAVNKGFTYALSSNTFTDENYPGSKQTQVIGINNNPFKTAGFYIAKGKTVGFTDYQGTFVSVAYPKKPFNQLLSQNDFGQAAGYYSSNATGTDPDVPYVFDEFGGVFEVYTIAAAVGGAQATGINNSSSVCGFYIDAAGVNHGWLQILGHFTVLDYPGSAGTQALGLNNQGLVVGSWTDTSGNSHGFVYTVSSGAFELVDDPDGIGTTIVNGINDNGVLVGFYGTAPINSGFVAKPGK